ncbi:MAG: 4'-phosphopantetheinyl transferase superfamily protein [Steroidobacteraceae bacterium]
MIAELLPHGVASAFARSDDPEVLVLPEEAALVGRAVESRRLEFLTARSCARRALQALGLPAAAILRGRHREPIWPPGVVGSITHCPGYRAAAAALSSDMLALGIDAELHESVPAGVLERVSVPEERDWLERAPAGVHWNRVLFSAKESIYKACFPLTRRALRFEDAVVSFEPLTGRFEARLRAAALGELGRELQRLTGRFLVRDGLVLTAVAVPRSV